MKNCYGNKYNSVVVERHRKNRMVQLTDQNGIWQEENEKKQKKIVANDFMNIFKASYQRPFNDLLDVVQQKVMSQMNDDLVTPLSCPKPRT